MEEPNVEPASPGSSWYGFVESQDRFVPPRGKTERPEWWMSVLEARQVQGLRKPNKIVWLSCIRSDYFDALPWRLEPCEIGNAEQGERRRERLLTLRPSALRVMPLLLCSAARQEYRVYQSFAKHDWHRVRIEVGGHLPAFSALDFDVDESGGLIALNYLGPCTAEELAALRQVFNLNFIPDADLRGERERGAPVPPPTPERGAERELASNFTYTTR